MSSVTLNKTTDSQNVIYNMQLNEIFPAQNIHRRTFELQIRKGTDGYVIAKCPELHVVSQGKTESDAIMDAVEFMESVLEESGKEKSFSLYLKRR